MVKNDPCIVWEFEDVPGSFSVWMVICSVISTNSSTHCIVVVCPEWRPSRSPTTSLIASSSEKIRPPKYYGQKRL